MEYRYNISYNTNTIYRLGAGEHSGVPQETSATIPSQMIASLSIPNNKTGPIGMQKDRLKVEGPPGTGYPNHSRLWGGVRGTPGGFWVALKSNAHILQP